MVFQNHSLLPWLTVYDNVRLAVDKVFSGAKTRRERHDWIMHNLELVQMGHAKDKRPAEISGGMKQRVGLARALAMEPKVLLLDEPFGALDALTRAHLQDSVMAIHQKLGNTVMMITHDVDEAVLLSDRIVMMTNGPAARIGEVLEVPLARPRKRLDLVADPTYITLPAARAGVPVRAPQGARSCRQPSRRRAMAPRAARRRRQRHGRAALPRGAGAARAGPLRRHGGRRRAGAGLQPRAAVVAAGRRHRQRATSQLRPREWYAEHGIALVTGQPACAHRCGRRAR